MSLILPLTVCLVGIGGWSVESVIVVDDVLTEPFSLSFLFDETACRYEIVGGCEGERKKEIEGKKQLFVFFLPVNFVTFSLFSFLSFPLFPPISCVNPVKSLPHL